LAKGINLKVIGVLWSHLSSIGLVGTFGLLLWLSLNCSELDLIVKLNFILVFEIEHLMQLAGKACPEVV
jgi:hypothetical protein